MPIGSIEAVRARITVLVADILKREALQVDVKPDARLADLGLASMDMVSLMLGVEAEFDFTIPPADITPETFRSVASIADMVSRQARLAA